MSPDDNRPIRARALQVGERIETKGLERDDAFSQNPLAFPLPGGGTAVLFRSGAVVFIGMSPLAEEGMLESLGERIVGPLAERESETLEIVVKPDEDDNFNTAGGLHLRGADPNRLLLVAEALAMSVTLAYDERRMGQAFERITPVAEVLSAGRLPAGPQATLLAQIGEGLSIHQRLARRIDLDDKPDVLWDHPEHERLWARLVDEYDLPERGRAIERKLEVIRETVDTITDLMATRTSHRLEWYIIALIALEIVLGLYDKLLR
ncbi:MAG: RMD1 family protein [Pseudomonadota bacterium]